MNQYAFLIKNYTEITVDSYAVVRNNTEEIPCSLYPISHNGNISQNHIVYSHNQNADIDRIHQSYSDFSSFTGTHLCVCVFSSMQFITIESSDMTTRVKILNSSITTKILLLLFQNHTHIFLQSHRINCIFQLLPFNPLIDVIQQGLKLPLPGSSFNQVNFFSHCH